MFTACTSCIVFDQVASDNVSSSIPFTRARNADHLHVLSEHCEQGAKANVPGVCGLYIHVKGAREFMKTTQNHHRKGHKD